MVLETLGEHFNGWVEASSRGPYSYGIPQDSLAPTVSPRDCYTTLLTALPTDN